MAIVNRNMFTHGTSGSIDKQITYRHYKDRNQTQMYHYPDMSNRVLTPKQIRSNEIMAEAVLATREVLFDAETRNAAQLRLNVPSNKLYHALKKEFLAELYKKEKEINAEGKTDGLAG